MSADQVLAAWPEESFDRTELVATAQLAASRSSPVFSAAARTSDSAAQGMMLAYPLEAADAERVLLAVELQAAEKQRDVVLRLLQWGEEWLRLLLEHPGTPAAANDRSLQAVIDAACQFDKLAPSAALVATRIASSFDCEQVAIGMLEKGSVVLRGISHSAHFDARTSLARGLEELMQECVEHGVMVVTPGESAAQFPAHAHYCELHQTALCTVPLVCEQETVGALLLQPRAQGLSAEDRRQLTLIGQLLGALFQARRKAERPLRGWFAEVVPAWCRHHLGRGGGYGRYLAAAALLLVALLALVPGVHRVSAPANLEGRIQRAVVAPIDGYVLAAHARAGETVSEGQLIAELDDRELKLELARLENRRNKLATQYRRELADLNHSQSRIVQSEIAQVEAELELVEGQLQRARLTVPFDGVIIEGDLSRSLGAPVERGQVLFEIAPLDEYRLVLQVDERDVGLLRAGQTGELYLNARPGDAIPFEVQLVATVHTLETGEVAYRTEARLTRDDLLLRPGMQGLGKIDVGKRSYLWILFHRIGDWLSLKLWAWLP